MFIFSRSMVVALVVSLVTFLHGQTVSASDIYQTIYQSADRSKLTQLLKDMTGFNPVTVGDQTFSITDRYLPNSKANFRSYFMAYFQSLGMQTSELAYNTQYNLESQGHNVEAVLPGQSQDSIVIIVHYDSMGPHGADNPAVDDDMTGMTIMMETARILNQYQGRLHYTVRFVAADYEEWGALEGAQNYLSYLQNLATQKNFKIIAAIDNEQSGWKEDANQVAFFSYCGGNPETQQYADLFAQTVKTYSQMTQIQDCMGANSDFYVFGGAGVPAVVFSENDPFNNPHYDTEGGDTLDRIDLDYFFSIAQIGVTYAAEIVGVTPDSAEETVAR